MHVVHRHFLDKQVNGAQQRFDDKNVGVGAWWRRFGRQHNGVHAGRTLIDGDFEWRHLAHPTINVLVATVYEADIGHQHRLASRGQHGAHKGLSGQWSGRGWLPDGTVVVLVPVFHLTTLQVDRGEIDFLR